MTSGAKTKAIKNGFNRLAETLGCRARIGGNAGKIWFAEWTGTTTPDGYEWIVGIDAARFGKLIANFPELHYYLDDIS